MGKNYIESAKLIDKNALYTSSRSFGTCSKNCKG